MKKIGLFSLIAVAAMSVAMSSCSKSEGSSVPEEVEESVSSEYYVAGYAMEATDSGLYPLGYKGVSDATVTVGGQSVLTDANGYYIVKFDAAKTDLTVEFSKSNYITISKSASFASDAAAGSSIIVSQVMSELATPATLSLAVTDNKTTASSEITLAISSTGTTETTPDATSVSMTIPSSTTMDTSAVEGYDATTAIAIAVTPYTPSTTSTVVTEAAASESDTASTAATGVLQAFNCSPSGLTFDTAVIMNIPSTDSNYTFTSMKHLVEGDNGVWAEATSDETASLASDGKSYDVKMKSFSNHALSVDFDLATAVSTKTTSVGTVDNLNTTSTKTETLSYKATDGCKLVGLYLDSTELTADTDDGYNAAYELYTVALTELGKINGTSEVALSTTITAAGDTSVAVSMKQSVVTYTFTANVSDSKTVKVVLESYGSSSVSTVVTYGNLRVDHNY